MKILLIEPNYKNKYPPLGLMKLSTYHKKKKDSVYFFKGITSDLPYKFWDRIYITTLFTFYFDLSIKTIRHYKLYAKSTNNIYIGGILASLMPDKIRQETGLTNVVIGLLDNTRKIGFNDNINIDSLTPDYSMLNTISYKYPAGDNYFAYTTRGCPNKCDFCAVPLLEPEFHDTNNIKQQIVSINKLYGEKKDLLLLDNNILYSKKLKKIVSDIKASGFLNTPNFIRPLPYELFLKNCKHNDYHDVNLIIQSLEKFKIRIKDSDQKEIFENLLIDFNTTSNPKHKLIKNKNILLPILHKYKRGIKVQRHVDFNQGIDVRLLDEAKLKILSEIPVRPLRIAFDTIKLKSKYINAVEMAAKYHFREISNYLLYNYNDKPIDLWQRIKLNTDLKEKLNIDIFSFPMKYTPIDRIDRKFIGRHWCKKYIRAIQSILLVKRGIVSSSKDFVERAFGKAEEDFFQILSMPEDFIIYRDFFEKNKLSLEWKELYQLLNSDEKIEFYNLIKDNNFVLSDKKYNKKMTKIMTYYTVRYEKMNNK